MIWIVLDWWWLRGIISEVPVVSYGIRTYGIPCNAIGLHMSQYQNILQVFRLKNFYHFCIEFLGCFQINWTRNSQHRGGRFIGKQLWTLPKILIILMSWSNPIFGSTASISKLELCDKIDGWALLIAWQWHTSWWSYTFPWCRKEKSNCSSVLNKKRMANESEDIFWSSSFTIEWQSASHRQLLRGRLVWADPMTWVYTFIPSNQNKND